MMDKTEIWDYIAEHLRIEFEDGFRNGSHQVVRVNLLLGGEVISFDEVEVEG